ncbi:MAG: transketolase [Firmicutes bacterium]|nr:transketolase [Bacillota bacterium]
MAGELTAVEAGELQQKANQLRKDILTMIARAGSGHPGGSLSIVDILAVLYYKVMRLRPQEPLWPERDRFVLSKGHACPALYAVLADKGFFPREYLARLRQLGSPLQGHPDMRKTPGVDFSTGSLGQGLSAANGMALAARLQEASWRVYVVLGDGEIQEGQVWEAAMSAAHYGLSNLIAFLDYNGLQIDGTVREIMCPEPLAEKWRAFGWHVLEIDGHDHAAILEAVRRSQLENHRPSMIIARTIKGKGVSFMEDQVSWHGKAPSEELLQNALRELEGGRNNGR